ncbi:helix-turn-helix domain-containing protein [Mycobacterium marinum]|uniref:helix-turn-helix domain-containing protein n=1 Tax=Mycobacterium marinum TaxID=1781 RepID=UPI002358C742|nr:helix-turn-helix domain-containing protein [Mycobacterium marinum]WCS20125.1 helix-turn-helix domain-containing protein [Mycobacterium marinum]
MDVTETDLLAAFRCASELLDRRCLQGIPIPGWLSTHYHRMRALSACGQQNSGRETQLDEPLTTQEVAAMLNTSTRHVRRHAETLGGAKVGRDWVFDKQTLQRYLDEEGHST